MDFNEKESSSSSIPKAPKSAVTAYDDLMRQVDVMNSYDSNNEFLDFVINQEDCRKKWSLAEAECSRLQGVVETHLSDLSCQERKIQEIRRHLEIKLETINKLELEKERMDLRIGSAKSLILSYLKDSRLITETRDRLLNVLSMLESSSVGSDSGSVCSSRRNNMRSPGAPLDTISEATGNSTDLSITQSEDDLDVSDTRRRRRNKRPQEGLDSSVSKRRRQIQVPATISRQQEVEMTSYDQVIAKTVVNVPQGGPTQIISSVETYPKNGGKPAVSETQVLYQPSAPPLCRNESTIDPGSALNSVPMKTHRSVNILPPMSAAVLSPRFGRTLSAGGAPAMRQHNFQKKTIVRSEVCGACNHRIKFSKPAFKCQDCRATCHPDCKNDVPLPCTFTGTPGGSSKKIGGTVGDFAPKNHPMVPGLVQHCVNEVELRGLDQVGLYRVSGSEKVVKELKEKFLRGKGVPNLTNYDIHAVCSCLKDFFNSLNEPLVGRWYWRDFTLAAELSDPQKRHEGMDRIIRELPLANQDTLAFMMLHLQRVAECPEVKMPIGNLCKVFGPTIVGFSVPDKDLDALSVLKEVKKQQNVVDTLLKTPGDYWKEYLSRAEEQTVYSAGTGTYTRSRARASTAPKTSTPHGPSYSLRDIGKKIYFSDDSPKKNTKPDRPQKKYFND